MAEGALKTVRVQVRVTRHQYARLQLMARDQGIGVSDLVRYAVMALLLGQHERGPGP